MLTGYESKIEDISEMYRQANELVILYETFNKVGKLSFAYELKDSYNHFMDAVAADVKLRTEQEPQKIKVLKEEIESELEGCRKHLFRLIFDAGEASGLIILRQVIKIFDRYPKFLVSKVYPKMNDEIRPKYLEFLDTLQELKIEKSSSSHKTVSDKLYYWVKDVQKFSKESLERKEGYRWSIFWCCAGWIASLTVSAALSWLFTYLTLGN